MCREDNSSDMKSNSETLLPLMVKNPAVIEIKAILQIYFV